MNDLRSPALFDILLSLHPIIVCVAVGERLPSAVRYNVFEIL